jgi:hypothetical protein
MWFDNSVYNTTMDSLSNQKKVKYNSIATTTTNNYRPVEYNYYYHRTLFEFNTDYLMSLKLFDEKTLAAQLLDALSGCITLGLNLSVEERMVQNEVRRMVENVLNSNDTTVNDCFFTFSNEAYDDLLNRSELQRVGLYVSPDGAVGGPLNPEEIMASINALSPNATHEQIQSAIADSLNVLSAAITPEYGQYEYDVDVNLRANFINNLLDTLAYVIVLSVLSPKLYLLMAVNLKIMERDSNFDLATYIESNRNLIVGVIRTIRDEILTLFENWLKEIIGELAMKLATKLTLEQLQYYLRLLASCIRCLSLFGIGGGAGLPWNMADVQYADIYEQAGITPDEPEIPC